MHHQQLLKKLAKFTEDFFRKHQEPKLTYHNLGHTKFVVKAATQIADHLTLKADDHFVLIAAAWFHDIGYFNGHKLHEQKGAEIAKEYLTTQNIDVAIIQKITACIIATKMPQKPSNQLEEILCDADLFHLGTTGFAKKNKLLREEYNQLNDQQLSKDEWSNKTIQLLENHHYYTDYCRSSLDTQKLKNLEQLKSKKSVHTIENAGRELHPLHKTKQVKEKEFLTNKKDRPEKGIETLFRVSSSNNSRLSDMADHKAHILITVNSIILSAIISLVLRKLDTNSFLTIPSFILLTVSLITIIFAILSTRPSIPKGKFTQNQIEQKKVNLLFFGNFFQMSLQDYTDAMNKVMDDRDFLYDNLIRDVYFQGIVLSKKYWLLRIAYNIFMFGLTVSVIAFIISSATSNKTVINHVTSFLISDLSRIANRRL